MKKWLFLFLFLFAIPAHAQINPRIYGSGAPSGTCTPPTEYLDTTNHILYICSNGSWANVGGTPNAAGGGSSSPSSLTTFFNKFYGLSPLDTGATGNWQYDNTCVTNSTTTMTCTSGRFVAGDTGKLYEISTCTAGFGATFGNGTLTFVNATTVTLSQAAPFTQASGVCVRWGTNDDTGMQSWKAGINAAGSVHGGYLPIGAFGITKALRFVAPAVTTNPCNSPLTSVASGDTNCGIWITGAGYTVSNIFVATAGRYNWAADGGAVNTAPMYFNGWSGGQLSGFSVDFDASAHDTTGQTGLVAGIMWDNVAHFHVNDIWVQGAHNTTNNLSGYMTTGAGITSAGPGAFESEFNPIIAEINDINLWACNVSSTTCEKETYANSFFEQSNNANVIVGAGSGSTIKQFRFDNVHLINSTNSAVASHQFITNTGVATSGGDSIVISNSRFQVSAAGAPFIGVLRFLSSNTALAVDINNTYVESTTGTFPLFLIPASTHANIRISGGNLNSAGSCVSGCIVADNDANSFVNIANTAILPANSTLAFKYGGSSSGNINAMEAVNTGWNGPGGITGTYFIANQGTACANSDFALSAGWGATATVTGVSGQGASCQVTITSAGAGQAANPTVTWTLKNPGPTPAALAKAFMVGGTGTFTTMNNTGLSATAPVFTFNGTPVAASTYIYTFQDGP